MKNIKICVVCGKEFYAPPSSKKITCGKECQRIRARDRQIGKKYSEQSKSKISEAAKDRDMSGLQPIATEAAKQSERSGRFTTNVNAIDWHLVSPEGKHYYFHSLNYWLRENCQELFGAEPESREFNSIRSGLAGAKRAAEGKNYGSLTYKGWRAIPVDNKKL